MRHLTIIIFIILFLDEAHAQNPESGYYQNDSATHGKLTNSLYLNCNYTFVFSFRSQCFDEKYFGSWIVNNDTLKLMIDSSSSVTNMYSDSIQFVIDGLRFYEFPWTKSMISKLKKYIKACNDNSGHKFQLKKSDIYAAKLHKVYSIKAPKGKGYRYINIVNRFQCRL